MNRCSKTGLTDQDFKTILDVLNMYDPNDVIETVPQMATPEFMQDVQSAFKAVLAHVNRTKYNSDMGAAAGDPKRHADRSSQVEQDVEDDLDEQDYSEADKQRYEETIRRLAHEQYIHSLS